MTVLMVVPLVLIVGYLFYQAWPALSLDFLLEVPRNGMRAGGHLVTVTGDHLSRDDFAAGCRSYRRAGGRVLE
jgi:hypothetical protein